MVFFSCVPPMDFVAFVESRSEELAIAFGAYV
jgi:hypothetical protein